MMDIVFMLVLTMLVGWANLQLFQLRKGQSLMATQADLDAGISILTADDAAILAAVTDAGTAEATAFADLIAKINANPTAPVSDFTAEVDALAQSHTDFQNVLASLKAVKDAATAADPGPQATA